MSLEDELANDEEYIAAEETIDTENREILRVKSAVESGLFKNTGRLVAEIAEAERRLDV